MELVIFILVLMAAFLFSSWFIWPRYTLWWLLQYQHSQEYKPNFHHVSYLTVTENQVILSSHVSLFIAVLIKPITQGKVTIAFDKLPKLGRWIQKLLDKCQIKLITTGQISTWDQQGALIIQDKVYDAIKSINLPVIPLRVCGSQHVRYAKERNVRRWLQLSFFEPLNRQLTKKERYELLETYDIYAWEHYIALMPTLPELWINQMKARGRNLVIADSTGVELSGDKMLVAGLTMAKYIEPHLREQDRIGICLPPSVGCSLAMMTVLLHGKTMVNLNYTSSKKALISAIKQSGIKTIITSGKFLDQIKKKGFLLELEEIFSQCRIVLLEDIKQQIDKLSLLKNLLRVKLSSSEQLIRRFVHPVSVDHTAVILFSSGSEGLPKGIELTQKNIIGNIKQAMVILDPKSRDSVVSILPTFHAFGLTATTLLPLLEGILLVCHPDPTDGETVAKLIEKYKLSMICGTSTFFRMYARNRQIKPEQFKSLRLVIAGAEKLQAEVRKMFESRFNKEIFEGYGTTELSPVASCVDISERKNIVGSVGKSVPGGRFMIIDPETKNELPQGDSGMITLGGVNVMKGYLNSPEKTDQVIFLRDRIRWYMTGDKGYLDEQGNLFIVDRYSRFAKIAGEMVSLMAVEDQMKKLFDYNEDYEFLAIATPDLKKGEKVTLLYNFDMRPEVIKSKVDKSDISSLLKPKHYFKVEEMPKLGSGKSDYGRGKELVNELLNQSGAK
ncbi:AMP-binding protein [Thiotrichales bacterium 19S9-12]|nr:AMP-binding protein [Thiotrichales bacterium 19S9-11]MCF6811714.1 AMP-binding protein [Thiotrichales bacterium 19S9-12]